MAYTCSNCHEAGHTVRSCPKGKPAAKAAPIGKKPAPTPAPPRPSSEILVKLDPKCIDDAIAKIEAAHARSQVVERAAQIEGAMWGIFAVAPPQLHGCEDSQAFEECVAKIVDECRARKSASLSARSAS